MEATQRATRFKLWRWLRIAAVLVATAALTAAIVILTAERSEALDETLRSVLGVYSDVATNVNAVGGVLALSTALIAGMLAAINPCGFAILPAYLSLYLSDGQAVARQQSVLGQIVRALFISLTMGIGFVVLFGSIGTLVATLSTTSRTFISSAFPWIGLVLGVVMIALGIFILLGGKLYSALPQRYASKIGSQQIGLRGYFLFGISYAMASLSCTLPLFIAIMVSALANGGFSGVLLTFLIYAGGMTLVVTVFTILVATFKAAATRVIFRVLPLVNVLSAVLIVVVGVYLTLYWLLEGDLIEVILNSS